MKAKHHTPGPWVMRRIDAHHPTKLVYCQIVQAADSAKKKALAYTSVYGKRSDGEGPSEPGQDELECLANAILIAAAPDLLSACQKFVRFYRSENKSAVEYVAAADEIIHAVHKAKYGAA